jgi:hypothetical protein
VVLLVGIPTIRWRFYELETLLWWRYHWAGRFYRVERERCELLPLGCEEGISAAGAALAYREGLV